MSLSSSSYLFRQSPDLIYYSATIINSSQKDTGGADPPAVYTEVKPTAFIEKANDWEMSVVKFQTEGGVNLPILLFAVQTGQSDVNLGIYTVTLEATVSYVIGAGSPYAVKNYYMTSQQPVRYIPEDSNTPTPSPPLTSQDISTSYYWVYTYSHFCDMVNNAFQACMNDLQAQVNAAWNIVSPSNQQAPPIIVSVAPVLTYSNSGGLFSLYFDSYGFGGSQAACAPAPATSTTTTIGVWEKLTPYFNSSLFALLRNFNSYYLGADVRPPVVTGSGQSGRNVLQNGMSQKIVVQDVMGQNKVTINSKNYFVMTQDYGSTSTIWSPISGIAFTTSFIPVQVEYSSNPVQFGLENTGQSETSVNYFEQVITDITLPLDAAHNYREQITYTPAGEYRMLSLLGSGGIDKLDLRVWYRLKLTNKLVPMTMPNQSAVTIKLMFRRKI